MNAAQATAKLRKLLGKTAMVRDYKRPSSPEQREADKAERIAAGNAVRAADEAMTARRAALLKADAEYQRLRAAFVAAVAARDASPYVYWRYELTTQRDIFTRVEAHADTLAELVEKVQAAKVTA